MAQFEDFQVCVGQWRTGVCRYMEAYMVNRPDRFLKARTVREIKSRGSTDKKTAGEEKKDDSSILPFG